MKEQELLPLNVPNTVKKKKNNTRKYLLGFKDCMTKSNTCLFATAVCLIAENVYGLPVILP